MGADTPEVLQAFLQAMGQVVPEEEADLREAAKRFSEDTGLGWDAFHPRLLLELGDEAVERLADLLNAWERAPCCGELWGRTTSGAASAPRAR